MDNDAYVQVALTARLHVLRARQLKSGSEALLVGGPGTPDPDRWCNGARAQELRVFRQPLQPPLMRPGSSQTRMGWGTHGSWALNQT